MSAPLSRLADKFAQLPGEPLLEVDGGVQQGGGDCNLESPLGLQRRAPVDPWLVGQMQAFAAIDEFFAPLDVMKRR